MKGAKIGERLVRKIYAQTPMYELVHSTIEYLRCASKILHQHPHHMHSILSRSKQATLHQKENRIQSIFISDVYSPHHITSAA